MGIENNGGLTKREYFAAHAPPMPEWFLPRVLPTFSAEMDMNNPNTSEKASEEIHHKKREYLSNQLRRWRWYYADTMLVDPNW